MDLLLKEKEKYEKEVQHLIKKIKAIDVEIERWKKMQVPNCSSCGKHKQNVWVATEKDVQDYIDQKEGYAGPTVGEYYCGC